MSDTLLRVDTSVSSIPQSVDEHVELNMPVADLAKEDLPSVPLSLLSPINRAYVVFGCELAQVPSPEARRVLALFYSLDFVPPDLSTAFPCLYVCHRRIGPHSLVSSSIDPRSLLHILAYAFHGFDW